MINRRKFLQNTALAGIGLSVTNSAISKESKPSFGILREKPKSKLNVGFIGAGLRGRDHVEEILQREDCNVVAINDIDPAAMEACKILVDKYGKKQPKYFIDGDRGYLKMLEMKDLDAVIIASPWMWHSEQAIACKIGRAHV